jgi:hypothetical protein
MISAQDTILSIEYDREFTEDNVHVQYSLIPEDRADGFLPANLYRKLQDSFCGVDTVGNLVPDPLLTPANRYGVQFRPRQSMFANRFLALENYLKRVNSVLLRYPIIETRNLSLLNSSEPEPAAGSGAWNKRVANLEELSYQDFATVPVGYLYLVVSDSAQNGLWTIYRVTSTKTFAALALDRVQNYDTRLYWQHIDWYLPGYNSSTKIIIEVPNFDSYTRKKFGEHWAGYHTPRHTALYSPHNIEILLKNSGWQVEKILTYGTLEPYTLHWMSEMERKGIDWSSSMESRFIGFVAGMIIHKPIYMWQKYISMGFLTVIAKPA